MKLRLKTNVIMLGLLAALAVSVVLVGTFVIEDMVYGLNKRILRMEVSRLAEKIEERYQVLKRVGVSGVQSYIRQAQNELVDELRSYRFGKTGHLFIFSGPQSIVRGEREMSDTLLFPYIEDMMRAKSDFKELEYGGQKRFAIFDTFRPWQWLICVSITEAEMMEKKGEYIRVVSLIALGILCVSMLLCSHFVGRLTRRISRTLDCVTEVERGDLKARITPINDHDEIGNLQKGINAMIATMEQRNQQRREAETALRNSEEKYRDLSKELTLGLTDVFDALSEIARGNPDIQIAETSNIGLIRELKQKVNQTAADLNDIVNFSHEVAMGLAEQFNVLHSFSNGNLDARIRGVSTIDLVERQKTLTNEMIESVGQEISVRRQAEEELRRYRDRLEELVKERTAELLSANQKLHIEIKDRKTAEKEKEIMQQQLQQAQKMEAIGTLAGGIAHDFNNILYSVLGFTELALDDVREGSPIEENLQEIYQASKRAAELVKQILTFSRQSDTESHPVLIQSIVKEVAKLLTASLPKTITIKQKMDSESLVMGDPTQIHQVLVNLCTNAGHAMGEKGGILTVSLSDVFLGPDFVASHPGVKPGRYLKLMVSDTGCGMTSDVYERIFDPFFTTKEQGEGTGMGLSVVHGIVKNHRGAITVESEPGKGTAITVFFPIVEGDTESETPVLECVEKGTERILFVDDEQSVVVLGKKILESLGYTVAVSTSSLEALEALKADPDSFDVLITDLSMPDMRGDELAAEAFRVRPNLPVIMCSGFSRKEDEEEALAMGIRGFLHKPILKEKLAKTIREVLGR